jgi:glycosyltransferase involved in cell wall biosynthesis
VLLWKVDHFFHYFKDVTPYHRYFGISARRSTFIPFKVNAWDRVKDRAPSAEGEYVFTSGRSQRDFETFMEAMERTGLPGLLTFHRRELNLENGTPFPPQKQPANVRIQEDDGSLDSWFEAIARARVVVVPILPDAIRAVGISQTLTALWLGKAVVLTAGITSHEVFKGEVVTVPPADPGAMADAIQRLWQDDALRREQGRRAHQYAQQVGGEKELLGRIVQALRPYQEGAGK